MLCVGLAGALAVELSSAGGTEPPEPTATANMRAAGGAAITAAPIGFTLSPLSSFTEVTERPLFSSTRRPSPKEARQNSDRPLGATLAGIVISGASRSIIVARGDPPVLTRLKQGDEIDGWSVRSIEPTRVLLQRGNDEQQIKFHDAPSRSAEEAAPKSETAPRTRR
jgi:hypothetical protein